MLNKGFRHTIVHSLENSTKYENGRTRENLVTPPLRRACGSLIYLIVREQWILIRALTTLDDGKMNRSMQDIWRVPTPARDGIEVHLSDWQKSRG